MDYSYYNMTQTPYPFAGYPEPNPTNPEATCSGFPSTVSPMTQNFDAPVEPFLQNVYDNDGFIRPSLGQHRQSLQSLQRSPASSISPSNSIHKTRRNASSSESRTRFHTEAQNHVNGLENMNEDLVGRARSSSEEKDSLTPVQSKRKAQNRAAQRAFRERKERHVKELEAKLSDIEAQSTSLHTENDRLKSELAKSTTENKILRATSSSASQPHLPVEQGDENMEAGPMRYTPIDFLSEIDPCSSTETSIQQPQSKANPDNNLPSLPAFSQLLKTRRVRPMESQVSPHTGLFLPSAHRVSTSPVTGQRLLSAGSTWEYILSHSLYKRGLVDVGDVSERLKGKAECDGSGPVFGEAVIRRAIEEAARTSVSMPARSDGEDDRGEDVAMSSLERQDDMGRLRFEGQKKGSA